jgi:NIPSNAP
MALYELRTYTLHVGKMAEAVKLYQEIGFPALQKGGQDQKLVGYFQSDTGTVFHRNRSSAAMAGAAQ